MKKARFSLLCAAGFAALLGPVFAAGPATDPNTDRAEIVHVLNRITFGPRAGDVEMVQKMGVKAYIEQQLHPESIDDSAVDQALAEYPMLTWSAEQLVELYHGEKKTAKDKKKLATAALEAQEKTVGNDPNAAPADESKKGGKKAALADGTMQPKAKADNWHSEAAIQQLEQGKLIRAVDSNRQLQEVLADFWNNHFNVDVKKKECRIYKIADDRDVIRPHIWGSFRSLLEADAKSPAMLYYLDNVQSTAPKGDDMMAVAQSEQDPAMMQEAAKEMSMQANTKVAATPKKVKKAKAGGLNENYGREIMELHTLGVDGGYTQKDVTEVARCFTGWSVAKKTGAFEFNAQNHDNGEKVVLGHKIPAGGGMKDGEMVLDILASSPATAHHISYEMCQRFVSDHPSDALVNRVAAVFTKTNGDLREVTEAILTSPEFLSPDNYYTKIKSPLEFAVSAVRASGSSLLPPKNKRAEIKLADNEGHAIRGKSKSAEKLDKAATQSLNWHIYELGQPLFACTPPTGYKEDSSTWVSPGALIERLNFAIKLTSQKIADVQFDPKTILGGTDLDIPDAVFDQSITVLLQGHLTDATRKVIQENGLPTSESKTINPNKLIALIIGSPEFQRK